MLTNGKIPPLTGGIRTLENLADSTDAEYEEDRPEKQFLRKLPVDVGVDMRESENKKTLEPEFQGFVCAPSGIRTLDTLIKSQLL